MNVIGKPDVYPKSLTQWFNDNLTPIFERPYLGEVRTNWYQAAFIEESGEFVTVERWNGQVWEQYGLDVHHTVEDLIKLNEEVGYEYGYVSDL